MTRAFLRHITFSRKNSEINLANITPTCMIVGKVLESSIRGNRINFEISLDKNQSESEKTLDRSLEKHSEEKSSVILAILVPTSSPNYHDAAFHGDCVAVGGSIFHNGSRWSGPEQWGDTTSVCPTRSIRESPVRWLARRGASYSQAQQVS